MVPPPDAYAYGPVEGVLVAWGRGSAGRERGGLSPAWVGIGAVALVLGLLFVLWSAQVAPQTLAPTPSPQALP